MKKEIPLVIMTFDPHPQQVVHPGKEVRLLTTLKERACLIEALGADLLFIVDFNRHIRELSYMGFAREILVKKLKAAHVESDPGRCFNRPT